MVVPHLPRQRASGTVLIGTSGRAIAVTCDGVSKAFELLENASGWRLAFGIRHCGERFQALEDISFDVPRGEFVGILGRNGVGKSTLLRVIGGIYHPDRGRVRVRGDLSGLYEIGTTGQAELTGHEYARRFLRIGGVRGAELGRLIDEVQEFSELDARFDDCIVTYSSGMVARLYFAVATARQHEVYLIDEILSVGDSHFQAKCWRRMRQRLGQGASGVLVTHDWSAILKLCRTAHIIDGGCIVFSGPAERVVRRYLYPENDGVEPPSHIARFEEGVPESVTWFAGEDSRLVLPVRIMERRPVCFRASIQRMGVGLGWEIVLMSRYAALIGDIPGRYAAEIFLPKLPLAPGRYVLTVALMLEPEPGQPERIGLDRRNWLSGDGIELTVLGEPRGAVLQLPMEWELAPQ
jgi:lipopolysaccharide transport system ATP-binding protein